MATENTHYGALRIGELLRSAKSVYFIGIGGINMSSLAHLTHRRGLRVGGSDRMRTDLTERLESLDRGLFTQVKNILEINKAERHIRGGLEGADGGRAEEIKVPAGPQTVIAVGLCPLPPSLEPRFSALPGVGGAGAPRASSALPSWLLLASQCSAPGLCLVSQNLLLSLCPTSFVLPWALCVRIV